VVLWIPVAVLAAGLPPIAMIPHQNLAEVSRIRTIHDGVLTIGGEEEAVPGLIVNCRQPVFGIPGNILPAEII
jgi:hypothetical protein